MRALNKLIGRDGEDVAVQFLRSKGFKIMEKNYYKPWGEVDIIAIKESVWHFVEVKSVTRESLEDVSRDTGYAPEDNVHPDKLKKIQKVAEYYINQLREKDEGVEAQVDVISVYLDLKTRKAKCKFIKNVL